MKIISLVLISIALIFFSYPHLALAKSHKNHNSNSNIINVKNLGAVRDGKTDSSAAFLSAWNAACKSESPSTIIIPTGTYAVNQALVFRGKDCKSKAINFVVRGTMVAPTDFRVLGKSDTWFAFEDVTGVSISGGVFDGRGASLWACKRSGKKCPRGATTLRFTNSKKIAINGLTSLNSQLYHLVFEGCEEVKVEGARVSASKDSPNTDGIHIQQSIGVTILNTNVATGDDCVSVAAGTHNLWIEDMACGPGHGVSIGSLGKDLNEPGVVNVTVKATTFTGTENGVRIKSWGRPSNGFVRDVLFQNLTMINAHNPIIIDQHYCPDDKGCPGQVSGVRITDVTYQDVHGSSGTPIAVKFDCSSEYHCTNIKLDDIDLTYKNQPPRATCTNVVGTTSGLMEPQSCF
ncbi:polygalacturonase [Beta vulgaris subsp. vulgaris]|uniref:polygalacturonase n=1 Tax=Beta vulgaris subsp. vulgaris TaxID=3555 RepID=UPI00203673FB|nr:polygalacturonase [Beta vulgaris subsp. vulgaris]